MFLTKPQCHNCPNKCSLRALGTLAVFVICRARPPLTLFITCGGQFARCTTFVIGRKNVTLMARQQSYNNVHGWYLPRLTDDATGMAPFGVHQSRAGLGYTIRQHTHVMGYKGIRAGLVRGSATVWPSPYSWEGGSHQHATQESCACFLQKSKFVHFSRLVPELFSQID